MELIKPGTNIDFVGKMKPVFLVSLVLMVLSLLLVFIVGPNYGVDFAGGTLVELRFQKPVTVEQIRQALQPIGLERSLIQRAEEGRDILIRMPESDRPLPEVSKQIQEALGKEVQQQFEILRMDQVGPQAGTALRRQALLSLLYASIGILAYISWRFQFLFAVAAVLALVHDILLTIGVFILLNKEFTLTVVAAILTIGGYSLNDTIVVFDRIREKLRLQRRGDYKALINRSINETLSRTLLTSGTTLLTVLSLFFLGGPIIHDFAFALLIGILVGTYSSIFVASPLLIFWQEYMQTKGQPKTAVGKR